MKSLAQNSLSIVNQSIDAWQLPPRVQFSQEYFDTATARKRGLVFDELWKAAIKTSMVVPAKQGKPFDAGHIFGDFADVKLLNPEKLEFFLSHNEYLYGELHNTLYVVYVPNGDVAELMFAFRWQDLKDHEAKDIGKLFQLVASEKTHTAYCDATGKQEYGWSVNVETAMYLNLL